MRLKAIEYKEYPDTAKEWSLTGLTLRKINLVVGKNATGKTRALNVICNLAKLLCGRLRPAFQSNWYEATYDNDGQELRYVLHIDNRRVVKEELSTQEGVLLTRGLGGAGRIYHEKESRDLDFQTPETDLAAVSRMDSLQHSFLQPLHAWGADVRHYAFGEGMGRTTVALLIKDGPQPDPSDVNAVIALFRKGALLRPGQFEDAVKQDMRSLGYEISDIGVMSAPNLTILVPSPVPVEPVVLYVREVALQEVTQQHEMSQGMFRALSILIHLNYAAATHQPSCIVVDDIGEGLDFDRSCRLIELLRRKALESSVQLLMSTNDRFVMNKVPLEEWSVLVRNGGRVQVRNYVNAKEQFDDFKFTGLNNFDFLATGFAEGNVEEEALAHEYYPGFQVSRTWSWLQQAVRIQ